MSQWLGALLLVCVVGSVVGEQPPRPYWYPEEESSTRQGRIFNKKLWDGFHDGLRGTADMLFSRVSDNLEVAFDQMASDFSKNVNTFADRIEKRVGGSLPDFLGQKEASQQEPFELDAISGTIGGVDDGLKVFYSGEEPDSDNKDVVSGGQKIDKKPDSNIFRYPNLFGNGAGIFNIFRRKEPWYKGENVCVEKEEIDESDDGKEEAPTVEPEATTGDDVATTTTSTTTTTERPNPFNLFGTIHMQSCTDNGEKYACVTKTNEKGIRKTVKVAYRCCHGFVRDGEGCTKIDLRAMPETLENLKSANDFLRLVKDADLVHFLTSENLTLFVPSNEAIEEYTAGLYENNEISNDVQGLREDAKTSQRETLSLSDTLRAHMTEGFVYAGEFGDEMILPSVNEKSTLRLNVYPGIPPHVTVNCARIQRANQHSLNGVVHTIDRVMKPVDKTIADIFASDPQFSILNKLLRNSEILDQISKEGQMTFFAPSDAAFKRLKPAQLDAFLGGKSCVQEVLRQHLLPNTICSTAIRGKMKTMSELDDYLIVERTDDDKLLVQDSHIIEHDIVATNGVVHIIDKPLIPNEGKTVGDVLLTHNITKFKELLELADMLADLEGREDITVFAPTNKAFKKIPEDELVVLQNDKKRLKEFLGYHVTKNSLRGRDVSNNHLAETLAGHNLRMNLYSSAPVLTNLFLTRDQHPVKMTAGCSRISVPDSKACGAVVHLVDDVLEVPQGSVLDALQGDAFSIFRQLVKDAEMEEELSTGDGPYTLLAPSDHVFKLLPQEELDAIMNNKDTKKKIVGRHIMKEHICCSGINSNNWLFMDRKRTMDGESLHLRRSNGRLMAGPARITDCGKPRRNGVVHQVNRLVVPDRLIRRNGNFQFALPKLEFFIF